jgi:hypothetical protein
MGWYLLVVQNIDGINYELQEYFDMSFISNYGKVFKVFDKQDSGCICFGVDIKNGYLAIFEWTDAEKELFAVAEKAVSKDIENRYQSINEFIIAWTNARKAK